MASSNGWCRKEETEKEDEDFGKRDQVSQPQELQDSRGGEGKDLVRKLYLVCQREVNSGILMKFRAMLDLDWNRAHQKLIKLSGMLDGHRKAIVMFQN